MTDRYPSSSVTSILDSLGVEAENPGAFDGEWIQTHGERVESLNPATGEPIAAVRMATVEDYERVAAVTVEAFREWRTWPAPRRGEVVRQLGEELRQPQGGARPAGHPGGRQDPLRGAGRGAGDDRHGGLRGRHVAPALRPRHALRAAAAPDVRAVAPAGPGRHHHRLQLPRRRLGLERHGRRRLRRLDDLEALAPGAAHAPSPSPASPTACSRPTARRRSSTWSWAAAPASASAWSPTAACR